MQNARDKPIITMVEMVPYYIRKRIESKQVPFEKLNHLMPPRILKLVENSRHDTRTCIVEYVEILIFQVKGF